VTLKGHFCRLKPFYLTYLGKYSGVYYAWITKHTRLVISTIFLNTKDFWRSQPITYTVNVVIAWKQCQMESLLLWTTNRKWYNGLSNRGNLGDLESPSRSFSAASLSDVIFAQRILKLWHDTYSLLGPNFSIPDFLFLSYFCVTWLWSWQ